jgi:hypothetical protein
MHSRDGEPDANITQVVMAGGASKKIVEDYVNDSGATIDMLDPVCVSITGGIKVIDPSSESDALASVGVAADQMFDDETGAVVTHGRMENIATSFSFGEAIYVSKTGTLTNVKPSIGVGSFVVGDWVIRMGTIARNVLNPLQKDLVINVKVEGQL